MGDISILVLRGHYHFGITEVYKAVLTALPEGLDFILHLNSMARLPNLPESLANYLVAYYLKDRKLFAGF